MTTAEKLEGWQQVATDLERMLRADLWDLGAGTKDHLWHLWQALGLIYGRCSWLEGGGT